MGNNKPQIRFKGFSEDWEERDLSQIINLQSGRDYKHLSVGNIPVFGTGGYMTSVNEALSYNEDSIGIGRKGTIDKPYILRAPFWTVDTLFYAVPKPNNDLEFLNCIFQKINWKQKDESTGVPSLSKNTINNVSTQTPNETEQQKIGNFFKNINKLITEHQQKHRKLKALKKAMLAKMFPQEGQSVPEIRFKGVTGDWEEKVLKDIIIDIVDNRGKNPKYYCTKGIPVIDNYMIKNNSYPDLKEATRFIDEDLFENFIRDYNQENDTLITLVGNGIGNITLFPNKKSVIIQNTLGLRFNSNKIFMFFYLLSINKKILKLNRGMAQPSIRQDELLGLNIIIPKDATEQKKIGIYFQNLDNLIAFHQKQLEKLQNIKKAFLAKMFI